MWRIENPELRPAKLDFKSSGQSWCDVTQLFADGVQIINAVELVSWDEDDTQFLICEQCGYFHCKRGDWVRVRRSDSQLFILPSFDHVFPDDEWDKQQFFGTARRMQASKHCSRSQCTPSIWWSFASAFKRQVLISVFANETPHITSRSRSNSHGRPPWRLLSLLIALLCELLLH